MNKDLWLKDSFIGKEIPNWKCPICKDGLLKIDNKHFHCEETMQSLNLHFEEDWHPECICYRFHGTLKCQHCEDLIAFLGKGNVEYYHYYDESMKVYEEAYNDIFFPLYFHPNLKLFEIIKCCPEDIKNEIENSFGHYWNDLPSCANKIRSSLELLMNQQKVKKNDIKSGKRLTLHNRIEEFKKSKPEVADFLLAIKWIGNSGSHIGKIEKTDILDAYELLEHSINKIYDDTESKLKRITKEINKMKGTRKHIK